MMMKRAASFVLFGLGTAILIGCPIYPTSGQDHRVCIDGECYDCPEPYYSSECSTWRCSSDVACPSGYACASDHRCRPVGADGSTCTKPSDCPSGQNCGADNKCHADDCSMSGCPSSFVCRLDAGSGGIPACVPVGSDAGNGGRPSTCASDRECSSPAGSKCLSGTCVPPQDQCVDATQCPGEAQCVDGACTPSCSASKPCPSGYSCDTGKGICTGNPSPCTSSSECTDGKACVAEHCVDPCGPGGTCPAGLTCVDGGCIPDQKPVFTCVTEGVQDKCQPGSVCLRHSCYIACSVDAGAEACKSADEFNQCKSVTTGSGTHHVCGSTNNLGNECDPTQNKACSAPLICIDGYCK
ncbi:MAG TPA: hypothetical protein VM580_24825 [Labilithrix sp.]|nr:hypothetical protein [Labilithrix sp.]